MKDLKNEAHKILYANEIIIGSIKLDNKKLLKIQISFIRK